MKWGVWALILCSVLCLAWQPAAIVAVCPSFQVARLGEVATVEVQARGAQGLYGADVRLVFDPALLEVVDADPDKPGVQVEGGLPGGWEAVNRADNEAGTVVYAATLLNPAPPVDGDVTLIRVAFRAKRARLAFVEVSAILANKAAWPIPTNTQGGIIVVGDGGGIYEAR